MNAKPKNSDIHDASQMDPFEGAPTFTLKHRLTRLAFGVIWLLFARWTPPQLHSWRAFILRAFGSKIGQGVFIYPSVRVWYPANLTMEDASTLGRDVNCYCMGPIFLGKKAVVSQGAYLCGGTHDVDGKHFQLLVKPIIIGDFSWVAAEAFVGPGVTVEEGAVLGARSVTLKSLEQWTVYSGNPATKLRARIRPE